MRFSQSQQQGTPLVALRRPFDPGCVSRHAIPKTYQRTSLVEAPFNRG